MKKKWIILIVLVVSLLFSMSTVCFANEEKTAENITVDKGKKYKFVKDDWKHYYSFKAPATCGYRLNVTNFREDDTYIDVMTSDGKQIAYAYWNQYKDRVTAFANLKKGKKYYICTSCLLFDENDSQYVTTKITKCPSSSTSIKKLVKGKGRIEVQWNKKSSYVKGYQVQVATNKSFTKNKRTTTIKGKNKYKVSIKSLKRKKKYYVRVRCFYYDTYDYEKIYSTWSKIKSIKTK